MQDNYDEYLKQPFLTVSEAARFMGVGKKIIYQLIDFGEIHAIRERGAVKIDTQSLQAFRASGKLT
ncbi:MAG: helix-turn-helix domain-containing protein [Desulfosarcinaceae bacterium]